MAPGTHLQTLLGSIALSSALLAGCATGADDGDALPGVDGSIDAAPDVTADVTADGGKDGAADTTTTDAPDTATTTDAPLDSTTDAPDTANPCFGVSCNTPPATTCADANNLRVYASAGTCDSGSCLYTSSLVACPLGCAGGKCNSDPCIGVSCNAPPKAYCSDATHLTVYVAPGSCTATGTCSYSTRVEFCSFGCSAGVCNGDPCSGLACNTPTANYCSSATELVVYDAKGTCAAGVCSYGSHAQFCSFGCSSGACLNDPCAGVSCSTPTASYCSGANTLRTFTAPGSCASGVCSYPSTEKACTGGCVSGVCRDCSASAPCAGGSYCNAAGTCTSCNSDQHCGGSCTDCTATGGVCSGGTTCVQCVTDAQCGSGKWCSGGTCASCNTAAHCGATCSTCSGGTPLCDGAKCTCDATSCGAGATCNGASCVACNTATSCGPSCTVCSGATPTCGGVTVGCRCNTSPDSCNGTTSWCTSGGTCAACGSGSCGNGRCDCGESSASCAADCGVPCPTGLSLATWQSGDEGWVYDGLWSRNSGGFMAAGSSTKYSSSYTQNLTSGSDVNLASCSSTTLKFLVKLADDPSYGSTDKSERLYVQCSGDSGATWTNLTPSPWPSNQSACSTSYCAGDMSTDRSFGWSSATIALPAGCLTSKARFRFQAKGSSAWNMMNPGWSVDQVSLN